METETKRNALINRYLKEHPPDKLDEWLEEDDRKEMRELFKVLFKTPNGKWRSVGKQIKILEWMRIHPLWQLSLAASKFFDAEVVDNPRIMPPYERYYFGIVRRCKAEYEIMKQGKREAGELEKGRVPKGEAGTAAHQRSDSGFHTIGDVLSELPPLRGGSDK